MFQIMARIGSRQIAYLAKVLRRLQFLELNANLVRFGDVECLDARAVPRDEEPSLALELFAKRHEAHYEGLPITITQDDRGDGLCLFRRNDDPRVDFSRIEGEKGVVFAHKGGFVAKLEPDADLKALLRKSEVEVVSS